MPRYYRRRRTVVRAPKKKWASQIKMFTMSITGWNETLGGGVQELVGNSASTSNPTPVLIKAGNFKVQGDWIYQPATAGMGGRATARMFIMYCPEGTVPTTATQVQSLVNSHPEWIMAWKQLEANTDTETYDQDRFSFSSRLKRNLNSGDKIICAYILERNSTVNVNIDFHMTAQYWTCAN